MSETCSERHVERTQHARARRFRNEEGDDALVRRLQTGDRSAFVELVARHRRDAHRFAGRLTRRPPDSDEATEVVAEALTRILTAISRDRGPRDGFRPYLFTTIRSIVATDVRTPRPQVVSLDALRHDELPLQPNPEHQLDRAAVVAAYRSLPERWRRVLWETEVNGLRPREAAPLFGVSPNALSVLARRAREGLRVEYARHDDASSSH